MAKSLPDTRGDQNPRNGLLAIVRNRRGIISDVRLYDGDDGRYHLVHLDYKDDFQPTSEDLVWELEPFKQLLQPGELPKASNQPMPAEDFDGLVRAARWTSISPYLDPDGSGPLDRLPPASPFHGAVEVEDYQLVPLHKALHMPRVNLMIADDVGLGKTVEAGLILTELFIRRRVNRVLILTPASLRIQWRDELKTKFSLPFDVVDRDSTLALKRTLGIDANPWRCNSRIIASYHYLRQLDILEEFRSASRTPEGSPRLPWDLLIVDEIHNLMPASFGEDSQLCKMLREIAPMFEHRLFLTATPHNGHTRSFTGLLEVLDPVRFSQENELKSAAKERVKQVVVRRLKKEINKRTDPPKFCTRENPQAIPLTIDPNELHLIEAYEEFRTQIRKVIADSSRKRRRAGSFALEILGKRMLSGPMTFLESWRRCKAGLADEESAAQDADVITAVKAAEEETADDREAQQQEAVAASVVGSWLRDMADDVADEIRQIDKAAAGLGVKLENEIITQNPKTDARFEALCELLDKKLRDGNRWRDDERIVIFTEYKTTLDYLYRRLVERFKGQEDRLLQLFGGMNDFEREQIKLRFSDPKDPARILLGTDAASEGLNLQATARLLLHYDCPWNPSRLEQRNGRLDRYGQLPRNVFVHHFVSDQALDLKFMDILIRKVEQIREDLGATGELFDEAIHRRLIEGESVEDVELFLDQNVDDAVKSVAIEADDRAFLDEVLSDKLAALKGELDLTPATARLTLGAAMVNDAKGQRPQLSEPDVHDCFRIENPNLGGWSDTIDETVRLPRPGEKRGPLPRLTFSPEVFKEEASGRTVFIPKPDVSMLHLAHPLMLKALSTLTRCRFPLAGEEVSRWTVRYGPVPDGSDALVVLHLEELAVNELRETFHHWVKTICIPVKGEDLAPALPHAPAVALNGSSPCTDPQAKSQAQDLLDSLEPDLKAFIEEQQKALSARLTAQLEVDRENALKDAHERYESRHGEVSELIEQNTRDRLDKEINQLKAKRKQGHLFRSQHELDQLDASIERKQEELNRRKAQFEQAREYLRKERERITKLLLPRRYALADEAQVFPVALEIHLPLPEGGAR